MTCADYQLYWDTDSTKNIILFSFNRWRHSIFQSFLILGTRRFWSFMNFSSCFMKNPEISCLKKVLLSFWGNFKSNLEGTKCIHTLTPSSVHIFKKFRLYLNKYSWVCKRVQRSIWGQKWRKLTPPKIGFHWGVRFMINCEWTPRFRSKGHL